MRVPKYNGTESIGRKAAYYFGPLLHDAPDKPSWWGHEKEDDPPPLPKVYFWDMGKRIRMKFPW